MSIVWGNFRGYKYLHLVRFGVCLYEYPHNTITKSICFLLFKDEGILLQPQYLFSLFFQLFKFVGDIASLKPNPSIKEKEKEQWTISDLVLSLDMD